MSSSFKPSYEGIGQILRSAQMREVVKQKAEEVLQVAVDKAPVKTGDYQRSLRVEASPRTDRAAERVVADIEYAWIVEFNTRNLGNALDAAKKD